MVGADSMTLLGWRIHRVAPGYTHSHPFVATAPGCPDGRHPTRDCRCRVFRTPEAAHEYVLAVEAGEVPP